MFVFFTQFLDIDFKVLVYSKQSEVRHAVSWSLNNSTLAEEELFGRISSSTTVPTFSLLFMIIL